MLCAFALLCGGRRWGGKIGRSRLLRIIKQEVCLCAGCGIHARKVPWAYDNGPRAYTRGPLWWTAKNC